MAEASIPVDLRNPGQVFACLGLMETAEVLFPGAEVTGGYDWQNGSTAARFTLVADGAQADPVEAAVRFIAGAEVRSLNAPLEDGNGVGFTTEKWNVTTGVFGLEVSPGGGRHDFPFSPPDSPAPLPIELRSGGKALLITHWGDDAATGRDNVKLWAGAGGYPGAALARDAVTLVKALGENALAQAAADPFGVEAPMSSCFRFDWRQSYVPLDAGFSPNAHGAVEMVGYPLLELLAAVGLEHSRPERPDPRNKLAYRYSLSSARLPTVLARALLSGQHMGFPVRRFRIRLDWPGQEGQARCIVDTWEE